MQLKRRISCKNSIWRHLRDILICAAIGNFIAWLFSFDLQAVWDNFWFNSLYAGSVGGVIWKGNEAISYYLARKIDMDKMPVKALRMHLFLMFAYSMFAIAAVNYIWYLVLAGKVHGFSAADWLVTMIIQFGITMIIGSILFSISFFRAWRESAVVAERLKRQSLALQYEALKNQVNPHFLFNSLNTLSSLVYKDPAQAEKFIKQLSEVYRYVLEHKDKELIALKTELEFVTRYVYLQKIRHGSSLDVETDISPAAGEAVIPMSVQILVENAIKHNVIAMDEPLSVTIYRENGFVVVRNNLNRKSIVTGGNRIGLANLKERYDYLSDKKFTVEEHGKDFTVKVPLLNQKIHEDTDH
ncbi:MAG: histidine kinase [Bacteroidales bacterium]|nr:histidine kinase [Bacteroidales bacterium]